MKFYSKYTNLQVLLPKGKITFKNGIYDATANEAKELKKLKAFSKIIWCDTPKKVDKDGTKGTDKSMQPEGK